jgi:hypothetical protein
MKERPASPTGPDLTDVTPALPDEPASTVSIGGKDISVSSLPGGLVARPQVGLVMHRTVAAQSVASARPPRNQLLEIRGTVTPAGDYLMMYPDGSHYGADRGIYRKHNELLAWRSKDKGQTWQGPTLPFDIDYNQHGFVPLIPRGSKRIYAFGTQPVWGQFTYANGQGENAPIGYRYSDDDGYTWSEVRLIRPKNDPEFRGMSVIHMTETDAGTWLLGSHEAQKDYKPWITREYILRSEDQGESWEVVPGPRHGGWSAPGGRMDEIRPINLGGGKVLALARTVAGHLWEIRSDDDGKTWTKPKPTPLIHPSAPAMLFMLSDGKTLAAFHHNRDHSPHDYGDIEFMDPKQMADRSEIWIAFSTDGGKTWSDPRFLLASALAAPAYDPNNPWGPWRYYQCSYLDMFTDGAMVHMFVPFRWQRAVHLSIPESDLKNLPTKRELFG